MLINIINYITDKGLNHMKRNAWKARPLDRLEDKTKTISPNNQSRKIESDYIFLESINQLLYYTYMYII